MKKPPYISKQVVTYLGILRPILFKEKYLDELYWTPRMWGPQGTVNDIHLTSGSLPYDVDKFDIYVNDDQYFTSNFDPLDTAWKNKTNSKDITKVVFGNTDPYFCSFLAAYVISYKTGISTSIARYYVYFHMKKIPRDPDRLSLYVTKGIVALVKKNIPTKKTWVWKFHQRQRDSILLV